LWRSSPILAWVDVASSVDVTVADGGAGLAEGEPVASEQGRESDGWVVRSCGVDVSTAVERCRAELKRRGIPVFAVFDHGAGAQAVGLDLAPEVVVVFGDPAVGTRLMQQDPAIGVELPLKLLVWEQDSGVRVGFVDPATWPARYAVSADHSVLAGMRRLLDAVAEQAAGPA
jgi:uncharacterized protein (DUF302 family)